MKGSSFNILPSFEDFSLLNKDINFCNQMQFVVSNNNFNSFQSIDKIDLNLPQQVPEEAVSIENFEESPAQERDKSLPIKTSEDFRTPKKAKKTGCVCKKTGCLKLYCECFKMGKVCTEECSCCDCSNHPNNGEEIENVRTIRKHRSRNSANHKACHCKKSQCQKKYCECFNAGLACTEECKCTDCCNGEESHSHE